LTRLIFDNQGRNPERFPPSAIDHQLPPVTGRNPPVTES